MSAALFDRQLACSNCERMYTPYNYSTTELEDPLCDACLDLKDEEDGPSAAAGGYRDWWV